MRAMAWILSLGMTAASATEPPDIRALVQSNSHAFELHTDGSLSGPGAEFLRRNTADTQFVLFGEHHHDRESPRLAGAIYRMLRDERAFDAVAVELDPLAIVAINAAPMRGDVDGIAALSKRYPTHLGFSSDQDLEFLAQASKLGPVWGLEQAQGATRYLEMLLALAGTSATKERVETLHAQAVERETRANQGGFLHDDPEMLERIRVLRKEFAAAPGSEADVLLGGLENSLLIYSYNRRANAGEYVGLYNNTEREALFKRHFVRHYRDTARDGHLPKVMFKFGDWHMYRGKSPGQAYTIGSFAHELAIFNGMQAYGISVLPLGGYQTWSDVPAWMRPLLPSQPPQTPVLIDLRPLRPFVRPLRETVEPAEQWQLRDFLMGFDALVILPDSAKATWDRTGFAVP